MVVEASSMNFLYSFRLLLIEDDENDYRLIRTRLSKSFEGVNLDWANSYEGGLDALCRVDYDACLLDYALGDRTGLDLLTEAREKGAGAALILLTGHGGSEIALKAIEAGASDYLAKDEINSGALERSIRYAVERKKAEVELNRCKDHLEELVTQRTSELRETNLRLRKQIHEYRKAKQALRSSEEKFRSLVTHSLDIIYTIAIDGIITSLSPAFETLTGWKPSEWVGRHYGPLVHPEDFPSVEERMQTVLRGEDFPPGEVRIIVKSGEIRRLEFKSGPLYTGNTIVGLIGTARDITARRMAEERIVQQNSFLKTVIESLSHPFYVIDAQDYSVVLSNYVAAPELPAGAKCHSLYHGSDRPCEGDEHLCPLKEIKRSKKPLITEHIHYDYHGRPQYVEVHAHPILDENGEVSKIIEYCLDITDRREIEDKLRKAHDNLERSVQERTEELAGVNQALMNEIAQRKRIEEALRLDESRLEALLHLSQVPWGSRTEISDYALEQQVKLTRSETASVGFLDEDEKVITWVSGVIGHSKFRGAGTASLIAELGIWAEAITNRKPIIVNDASTADRNKKGLPFSHISLRRFMSIPIFDQERVTAVAILANKSEDYDQSDIRQSTLLNDGMWKLIQLKRSIRALKEAESLAGIGKALSCVAHDMRTPLIAIGGFAKQVQRNIRRSHPDWNKMEIVLNEVGRLEKMVNDMLDFSKPLDIHKSLEQITIILDECIAVSKPLADKKNVELQIEAFAPPTPLWLDRLRLQQAFINLLTNAIEASPESQTVKIRYYTRGDDLFVEVVDRGPGIAPEIRKDIFFTLFYNQKRRDRPRPSDRQKDCRGSQRQS